MRSMRAMGVLLALAVTGCASGGGGTAEGSATPATTAQVWPVLTRQHVDLWLHGYAMLLRDTARPPVFRSGYRDRLQAEKTQRGVTSQLDANRERLQSRLTLNPALANGQFAPLYFASFDQMRQVIGLFVQAEGDPRATNDRTLAMYFAVLRQSFPSAADRDWLRIFTESLEDERRLFYQQYWTSQHSGRLQLVRAADSLWQGTYRERFQRFLNNTQQEQGEMILALTLGGEGRTVNFSARQNAVAVAMPDQDPREAIYVFAHEIMGGLVATAVNDNLTPAEQRTGVGGRYVTAGAVRGGALLVAQVAPELLDGYTRYYLMQAGVSTSGDIAARLASTYPIPDIIREAIVRQLQVVLGGI